MSFRYPLFKINFRDKELENLTEIIKSGWISQGPYNKSFEEYFSNYFLKKRPCITTSSCTTALSLALNLSQINKGDEVLISSVNFISVVNNILHIGAIPKLIDSKNFMCPNISLDNLKDKVSAKTKAVVAVHFAGYVIEDIEEIQKFCNENGIILIEDVAHAPLATNSKGDFAGTFGDYSAFSFFANKNIPAGEGGILSFLDNKNYRQITSLKSHGMTVLTQDRYNKSASTYDVDQVGFNYRMPEISSSIALAQAMSFRKEGLALRRKIIALYRKHFQNSDIELIFNEEQDKFASPHIAVILLPENISRDKVQRNLMETGIQTSMHYPSLKSFSITKQMFQEEEIKNTEIYCERCITIPLYDSLNEDQIEEICYKVREAIG